MKLCIDTCAYTALRNGNRKILELCECCDELFFPATVVGELHFGFMSGSRREENMRILREFIEQSGAKIAPVTLETAFRYGMLAAELKRNGRPMPQNDILIAATAMELGARLATRDSDFGAVPGLPIEWI